MTDARFIVGIDLGTTHTVVAAASMRGGEIPVVFGIPQLVTASAAEPRPLLPSLLFAAPDADAARDPWGEAPWVKGEFARRRGAEVPGRLVASAKSWLCHAGVDRTAPILPWGEEGDGPRISPCDASAALLRHVRQAWDEAHPEAPLARQEVVLTVPASFDDAARELTLLAAERAGIRVMLLEEPQAAFYDYRERAGDEALAGLVQPGGSALVLVCDVGGGTTDLSLLRLDRPEKGAVAVTRVAVGRHLLLGGDNMDLALAHACEARFGGASLDPARYGQLVLACRAAKEALLGDGAPDDAGVSVAGAGARLVGNTLSTRLTREEVATIVVDGFFPRVDAAAQPVRTRAGLVGFGLPYERDFAITRHVAAFFRRHAEAAQAPKAVLLNGGVFHAPRIAERLVETLEGWGGGQVTVLPHAGPDLAVARGAVSYGLARRGRGRAITSGSARGYYVEVATRPPAPRSVVCIVPRGTEEGVVQVAAGAPLEVVVGRPARFELHASDNARGHRAGDVFAFSEVDLEPLPPLFASFGEGGKRDEAVPVVLQGELTPVGTLDLSCVETRPTEGGAPRKFRLAFRLREDAPRSVESPSVAPPSRGRGSAGRPIEEAQGAILRVFGKSARDAGPREVKDLVRELERPLGERGDWDAATTRAIFDAVMQGHKGRRRSPDHERVFWQLAGYCLRPGVGDPGDPARVATLAGLFRERLAFPDEVRGWQQFWFAWRRIAAGLDEAAQVGIRDMTDPLLSPAEAGKKRKGARVEALDAMLETASWLERVPPARKAELGGWILERTWTDHDPRLWSAIGRLGARVPAYASASYALPAAVVDRWMEQLLRRKWGEIPSAAEAALRMARVTGDRVRDLPERVRKDVAQRLARLGVAPEQVKTVTELVDVEERDRAALFGEGVPVGLRLVG